MEARAEAFREICLRCRRPKRVCWCDAVTPVPSRTRVVFIQHPREFKVPISTCRMAHLSLPNSELHVAVTAVGTPALEALCARPGTALLFPLGDDVVDADTIDSPPQTLVVVDGTWANARKLVTNCPLLSKLPRLAFRPDAPSRYRIRAEPDDDFVSTIEATAIVLEKLERAPGRFLPILTAFDAMVERQLDYAKGNERRTRHARLKARNTVRVDPLAELKAAPSLVAVFGEANAWPLDAVDAPAGEAELVQLVAERLDTGARFEAFLRPTRRLAPSVPLHLDLPSSVLETAEPRGAALERWAGFLKPGDVLVGWGRYCRDLLEREGHPCGAFIDVRAQLCQLNAGRPGSVEACAARLEVALPEGRGRAARRLNAVAAVTRAAISGRATDALSRPGKAR
ncbi:MAG: DTW domain-containing protein [Myxococcaceae bacterium]|nr:DTW domain-containing protein [Myxococcaceae bacterium]